jgi:hypothetical protein
MENSDLELAETEDVRDHLSRIGAAEILHKFGVRNDYSGSDIIDIHQTASKYFSQFYYILMNQALIAVVFG